MLFSPPARVTILKCVRLKEVQQLHNLLILYTNDNQTTVFPLHEEAKPNMTSNTGEDKIKRCHLLEDL